MVLPYLSLCIGQTPALNYMRLISLMWLEETRYDPLQVEWLQHQQMERPRVLPQRQQGQQRCATNSGSRAPVQRSMNAQPALQMARSVPAAGISRQLRRRWRRP